MKIELTTITKEHLDTFLNLYNLYLYDLSEFTGEDSLDTGLYDLEDNHLYVERDELHPFFITYEGRNIGFVLVCAPPFVPKEVDFTIQEMFLLRKYRGMGIAKAVVERILERFHGKIRVDQLANNMAAVHFWKKYYREHLIQFTEREEKVVLGELEGLHTVICQTFDND
ncbi:GNAT family N-acetyltransferase [Paenibacillus puldeungensis]|uniref:GNAT family N-acetyltransferase n=1 Tax=Paenibacillus puldeungensis TaxID=696536 RepID=A0ABW3S1I3_9BACL